MADETHFQITGLHQQHFVDLCRMTCSCRKWDLTGIPCEHAVCAIWCKQENPEAYVHRFYSVLKYKQCYSRFIMPINGPALWPECQLTPPLPPIYKEKVGRPAKLRRRQPDEVPASRQSKLKGVKRNNKCRTCGGFGHNQKSCNITKASGLEKPTQENNEMDRGQIQAPQNYNEMDIGDIESAPQTCNEAEFVATGQGNTTSDESERFISTKLLNVLKQHSKKGKNYR
ncbi:uncharacterized protein [Primulina huaijiensis]|uniref:uncharacterized protein n=1 Tax=Primulina huaijiensis TaxID=1492673 RepID=UPI003CC6E970